MSRFVKPITKRITLTDGDWIVIKHRLPVGDQKRVDTSGLKRLVQPQVRKDRKDQKEQTSSIEIDFKEFSFARTEAYLLEWSFLDDAGQPVALNRSSIEALDTASYDEIENAITAHVEALAAEKKETPPGGGIP